MWLTCMCTRMCMCMSCASACACGCGGEFECAPLPTLHPHGLVPCTPPAANLVYLRYCTSDAYIGDAASDSNAFGFAFRGRAVVDAVFATLREDMGLGSLPNTSLVYR